jgi:plastocyanin
MRIVRPYLEKAMLTLAVALALVVLGACSSGPTATTATTTPPPGSPTGQPVTVNLIAQDLSFDTKTIVVPPGARVTINFNNKDSGIMHNFALYTDSSAKTSLFVGSFVTGPATTVYTFTAPTKVGNYFFRCDVHPTQMTGTFVVE